MTTQLREPERVVERAPEEALQATLVELIELALQGKQAHWNVAGPLFAPVHGLLDEFVDAYRTWYDDVAERLAAIGGVADGRTATIAATASIPTLPSGRLADASVVDAFDERVSLIADRIRVRAEAMDDDLASQDLLVEILRGLEKQRWMLRAQRA